MLVMPQRSRVMLLNDIFADILTMALRGASSEMKNRSGLDQSASAHDQIDLVTARRVSTRAKSRSPAAPSDPKRSPGQFRPDQLKEGEAEGRGG